MKNLLVVSVAILLISISFTSNITADESIESENSELVEITVQICELDSIQNYTILITHQQLEELNNLIDNVENQLDNANSIEECKSIYESAVLSLNNIGVLPDELSVEEYQQLVTDINANQRTLDLINRLNKQVSGNEYGENQLCLIAGQTNQTFVLGPFSLISATIGLGTFLGALSMIFAIDALVSIFLITNIGKFLYEKYQDFFNILFTGLEIVFTVPGASIFFLSLIPLLSPLKMISIIGLGIKDVSNEYPRPRYYPANGWVSTFGTNGVQNWDGEFYGQMLQFPLLNYVYQIGVLGFTGIKIGMILTDTFYIGTALKVAIGPDC